MADISITAANVRAGTGAQVQTVVVATGVTVTQGQALYRLDDGTVGLADCNGNSPANRFYGFALSAGGAGQTITLTPANSASEAAYVCGGTVTSGAVIFLSPTPGGITLTTGDIVTGCTRIVIGVVNTDLTIKVAPIVGGVIP